MRFFQNHAPKCNERIWETVSNEWHQWLVSLADTFLQIVTITLLSRQKMRFSQETHEYYFNCIHVFIIYLVYKIHSLVRNKLHNNHINIHLYKVQYITPGNSQWLEKRYHFQNIRKKFSMFSRLVNSLFDDFFIKHQIIIIEVKPFKTNSSEIIYVFFGN